MIVCRNSGELLTIFDYTICVCVQMTGEWMMEDCVDGSIF